MVPLVIYAQQGLAPVVVAYVGLEFTVPLMRFHYETERASDETLDYSILDSRIHYTALQDDFHYTALDDRLHYSVPHQ